MIIRSPFHDYYDSVAKQGVDRAVTYEREPKLLEFKVEKPKDWWCMSLGIDHTIIVFCGQVYPFVRMTHILPPLHTLVEKRYCYSMLEVDDFQQRHLRQKALTHWSRNDRKNCERRLEGEFVNIARPQLLKLASEHNAPILVYDDYAGKVHFNTELKRYQFYRVKNVYSAYQELYQYVSAQAQPEKVIPSVPDNVMAEIKGFDAPWSFRKMPEKG
jgi:hypothetical protein